jgi:L-fuconolactonase
MAAIAACAGRLALSESVTVPGSPMDTPILDAHIHLFDPTRAGGVPWPLPDDPIYKPSLPGRYEVLAQPLGIVGAIAIEASPLRTDNDWLLRVVQKSNFMVGMIGDLPPTVGDFGSELDRLHRHPLFLGIRHGNLWNRNLSEDLKGPKVWQNLRHLAACNLVFETANPDLALLKAVMDVSERLPHLRIVVDHIPHMNQPIEDKGRRDFARYIGALGAAPNVSIKLSEIPELRGGTLIRDVGFYREHLDMMWNIFGEDRCIFGSDWPNSDHVASLPPTVSLVKEYLSEKSLAARRKFFMDNSRSVYRWEHRGAAG